MAVKDSGKQRRGAGAARELARGRRDLSGGPSTADRFNAWAFFSTMGSWLCLLLGQRVLDSIEWFASLLTYLAVAGLVICFGQRVWAVSQASTDRRSAARALAVFSGLGLLALAVFYATTNAGREMLGIEIPKLGQPDLYGDIATVLWVSLVVLSILPSVLGELARRSMLRAERIESRRVVAAVVAGVALASAAIYGSLFAYSADEMDVYADFSYFRVAKPSDSTRRMLDSLDEPLKVLVFFPGFSEVRPRVVQYLEELRKGTDKLEIEILDRELYPDRAHEHKVTKDGVLVLVKGKNSKKLELGDQPAKVASKLKKLDGEFQKVLLQAMRKKRTVYLTVGHGELNESTDRKSQRTVKLLRQLMESQNYGIKNLGLAKGLGNEVPDDAAVVAILGPTEAFSEPEMEALAEYAAGGGSLFMALDPDDKVDHAPLAALVGLKWEPGLVINDKILVRIKRAESDKRNLVVSRFSSHASVSTMSKYAARGAAVLLPGAAALDKLDAKDKSLKIDFALKSVPGCYVDLNGNWTFDRETEKKKVYNLAAAVSKAIGDGKGPDKLELRAFVMSDAEALSDPILGATKFNPLLFVEALRWLGGEESFSGAISSEEDVAIVHTKNEDQIWFYTAILVVPSIVLGGGLLLTRRDRRRKPVGPRKRPVAAASPPAEPDEDDEDEADEADDDEAYDEEDEGDEEEGDDEEDVEDADSEDADSADADSEDADSEDDDEDSDDEDSDDEDRRDR